MTILLVVFLVPTSLNASHLAGGEITYECLGGGIYKFRATVFRDCYGIPFQQTTVNLAGPVNVVCNLVASYDITPNLGNCSQSMQCTPPNTFNGSKGSLAKFVYEGTANLSSLNATPAAGYTWYTSNIPCCRNQNRNAQGCSNLTLRVTMYPFTDPATNQVLSPGLLCDKSPQFLEDPYITTILNPFDTVQYYGFGQDPDPADFLKYALDFPWQGNNQPCNYTLGYSIVNPIVGFIGLDSSTGVLSFRPTIAGDYIAMIRVSSYRGGQLISSVYRDFQLSVIANPVGAPPLYNPSNLPGTPAYFTQQKEPVISGSIVNPVSGSPDRTIYLIAGDTMSVSYTVKDSFPTMPQANRVYTYIRSDVLGSSGTNPSSGCAEPPCAVIQSLGNSPVSFVNLQNRWNGYGIIADTSGNDVNGRIVWTTSSQHARVNGKNIPREYRFGLFAFDDVCPLAGTSAEFFEVVVFPNLVSIPAPKGLCVEPLSASANLIRWNPIIDSLTIDPAELLVTGLGHAQQLDRSIQRRRNSFIRTELIRTNASGGSVIVASLSSPDVTSFTDATAASDSVYSYQIRIVSALDTQLLQLSNAVVAPRPAVVGDRATLMYTLSWQPPYSPTAQNPGFTGTYYIYQRNVSMQSAWQLVDSVVNLTSYSGSIQLSNDTLAFRIGWLATNSCAMNLSHTTLAVFDQSLSTPELDLRVRIYPNPVGEVLNVSGLLPERYSSWRIVDITGKLVLEGRVESEQIATQKLVPGNYFLDLLKEDKSINRFKFQKK